MGEVTPPLNKLEQRLAALFASAEAKTDYAPWPAPAETRSGDVMTNDDAVDLNRTELTARSNAVPHPAVGSALKNEINLGDTDSSLAFARSADATWLPVGSIEVREQARKHFDGLKELAANIKQFGQLQPIVVCRVGPERYRLMYGERRLRAVRDILCREQIYAVVSSEITDATEQELAQLSENVQRKDYQPLELARCFARLIRAQRCTQDLLAERLQVSKSWISKRLSLLDAPEGVQEAIEIGKLSETDYYNHKAKYDSSLGGAASDTTEVSESVAHRLANVQVPMANVKKIAELIAAMLALSKRPLIPLSARPSKNELLAFVNTYIDEALEQARMLSKQRVRS